MVPVRMGLTKRGRLIGGMGVLAALLACVGAIASAVPAAVPTVLSDEVYTDIDEDYDITTELDLLKRENVSCPQTCNCRRSSAGQIVTARCHSFDWGKQTFEGLISALEVDNAPPSEGFFLGSHSLASVGLKDVSAVRIIRSSLTVLNETAFAGLDKLEEVDLSDNKIKFPHRNAFRNNTNLQTLSLSGNPLRLFMSVLKDNEYLMDVPSLYKLDLSRCGIDVLKPMTFSRLKLLNDLKLSGNELRSIHPNTFYDLLYLERVDLSDNNLVEISPDLFRRNTEMTVLNLRNNSLTSVMSLTISSLEELDLSQNDIDRIGEKTFSGVPNLVQLNLSANKISVIHDMAFVHLKNMRRLDLSANNIAGPLSPSLFSRLSLLEELSLSDNPTMGSLPDSGFEGVFNVLHKLDLSYCELTQLRVNHFKNMGELEHLNLRGNRLQTISPRVFALMTKLRTLDLSKNVLRSLDDRLLEKNAYLQHLYLAENPLVTISSNMLPASIKEVDLGSCHLQHVWAEAPERLNKGLTRLTHLNLYGNKLREVTIPELAVLKDLTVLDLGNNPIDCSDTTFYGAVEWLIKQPVSPSYVKGKQIVIENSAEYSDENLRVRWTAVYDSICGDHAFINKAAEIAKAVSKVPDVFPTLKDAYTYEDSAEDEDDSEDEDETDDLKTTSETDADDDTDEDDQDDDDEDDGEEDDSDAYIDIKEFSGGLYPFWPTLLISGSVFVIVLSLFMIVTAIRRRQERRNRYKAPMFRNLGSIPAQHKFAGIRKDGGFIYKKLYEETTTPNVTPSAPFILRSPGSDRV